MASILKVDELQGITAAGDITITSEGGAATQSLQQGLVKAWVNFNGTGTVAIRISLNTSSIVDNGTGQYSQNFSSSFSGGYCTSGCVSQSSSWLETEKEFTYVNTKVDVVSRSDGGGASDTGHCEIQNFGDLA